LLSRAVVVLALATGLGVAPGVVASAQAAIGSPGGAGTRSTGGQRAASTINGCAYVTNAGSDTVSVINTRTSRVVADVPVAPVPAGIAITRN
jgi:YVTN family beta-propeller protein